MFSELLLSIVFAKWPYHCHYFDHCFLCLSCFRIVVFNCISYNCFLLSLFWSLLSVFKLFSELLLSIVFAKWLYHFHCFDHCFPYLSCFSIVVINCIGYNYFAIIIILIITRIWVFLNLRYLLYLQQWLYHFHCLIIAFRIWVVLSIVVINCIGYNYFAIIIILIITFCIWAIFWIVVIYCICNNDSTIFIVSIIAFRIWVVLSIVVINCIG